MQKLPPVIAIACSAKCCQPLMGMGLQERRAGADHLSTLAPRVARGTDRSETPLWRGQIRTLRQGTLSCSLSRSVQIEDHPPVSLPIPQTTYTLGGSRAGQRVLQKHTPQRFYTRLVQGGKKTAERRAMRQLSASEQSHKRRRKRLQALVIGRQRRFSAECVADQHDEKVDHLIGPEPFAGETHTLRDVRKQALTGQGVGDEGNFAKPGRHRRDRRGFGLNAHRGWVIGTHRISCHFDSPLVKPWLNGHQERSPLSNEGGLI